MLWLVRGLPGSGKSAYAAQLGCLVIDADYWHVRGGRHVYDHARVGMAREWCRTRVEEAFRIGFDVAVVDCFPLVKFMDVFVSLARNAGVPTTIVEMTGECGGSHHVPRSLVRSMAKSWEPIPTEWERMVRIIFVGGAGVPGRGGHTGEASRINWITVVGAS